MASGNKFMLNKDPEQMKKRKFPIVFVTGLIICAILAGIWGIAQSGAMVDLYPLYYGGIAWRQLGNAYTLKPVVPASTYDDPMLSIGNAYPLPAVLILLPLSYLPPNIASTLWVVLLTVGTLIALRISHIPYYFFLYLPLLDGINLQQYAILVVALQFIALWAYEQHHDWILAICCTLILTKPSQGFIFVLALVLLSKKWRHFFIASVIIWGGSLLLDPKWLGEWLVTLPHYMASSHTSAPWYLITLAVPLLLIKDYISTALVAQLAFFPHQTTYTSVAMPIGVIRDKRSKWLIPLSYLWPLPSYYMGKIWGTALAFALPVVIISVLRWWEQTHNPGRKQESGSIPINPSNSLEFTTGQSSDVSQKKHVRTIIKHCRNR
jgi:hypothetical protein